MNRRNHQDYHPHEPEISPEEIAEKEKLTEDARNRLIAAWDQVVRSDAGLNVVKNILDFSGYFQCPFTGNSLTNFREGKQEVGRFIINQVLAACPDMLSAVQLEFDLYEEKLKVSGK